MKKSTLTRRFVKPYRRKLGLYIFLTVIAVVFTVASIFSVSNFLQVLFGQESTEAKALPKSLSDGFVADVYQTIAGYGQMKALLIFGGLIFVLYFIKDIFSYIASCLMGTLRSNVVRDIRNALFRKYVSLPLSYFVQNRKGEMLSHLSNDVIEFDENTLKSIQQLVIAIISILLYVSVLFYISYELTLLAILVLPVVAGLAAFIRRRLRRTSKQMQQKTAYLLAKTEETISGIRVIKSHTAIEQVNDRFHRFNSSYSRLRNRIYRRVDLASPQSEFLGNCMVISILLFGGQMVLDSTHLLSPEIFIVYLILFTLVINPAKDLSTAMFNMKKGEAIASRIAEVLDIQPMIEEDPQPILVEGFEKSIDYCGVGFSYVSGDKVLKDISFSLAKGKTLAIVGHSGSGKSTLVDLLPRFYDCTEGGIYINGINIKKLGLSSLRSLFGIVSQEPILFNESVSWNISFGKGDYTQEEIERAAKIANAHEFIVQMPEGYQTRIGDRGGLLSGGQRQRLSIARAVLADPQILILDEATSSLDTQSERLVQDALVRIMEGRTAIVIAHRVSTIVYADEIFVLDEGRIVQRGNHGTLYAEEGGLYRKLCDIQSLS